MFVATFTRSVSLCGLALLAALLPLSQGDQCLANDEFETFFLGEGEALGALPREGSCCQNDICGLPCPTPVSDPTSGKFSGYDFSAVLQSLQR
jgi:hypothetical protein